MTEKEAAIACSLPHDSSTVIRLGHGSGGKMTSNLIESVFMPQIGNEILNQMEDAALFEIGNSRLVFTTDSYVVSPIFFPGGDIGSLAVHGTVNDLAMRGAMPLAMTCAFIMEEGFAIDDLNRLLESMKSASIAAGVPIIAADTKVVGRGAADRIFINTTGIGRVDAAHAPSVRRAAPGDYVIVNGDIGRHGIAVMTAREGLGIETDIASDSASLSEIVQHMLAFQPDIHCLRDVTRGGLAGVLNEIAYESKVGIMLEESLIPLHPEVQAICELLGLDPLYVACEGRFVAVVESSDIDSLVEHMKRHSQGIGSRVIGRIVEGNSGRVILRSSVGGKRIVDKLSGEQLPRIC